MIKYCEGGIEGKIKRGWTQSGDREEETRRGTGKGERQGKRRRRETYSRETDDETQCLKETEGETEGKRQKGETDLETLSG